MYGSLEGAVGSAQAHLQKVGLEWKQVCAELQNVNEGYRLSVFVSGRNISDGANDNSIRLDLRIVAQLGTGGIGAAGIPSANE
jgi:hypothetical protein